MKNIKQLQNVIEYFLLKTLVFFFRLLPDRLALFLLKGLAFFASDILRIRRKVVKDNLIKAFPEKNNREIEKIIHKHYYNLTLTAYESFIQKRKETHPYTLEGWELIEDALEHKRGVLVISGHFGNWELAGQYLAQKGVKLNVIIKRLRNPYVNDYINAPRQKAGINIIYKSKNMKPVFRALMRNEIVVMLVDQDAGKEGVRLPFLGREASIITGYARIALKMDTPLVLGIFLRERPGYFHFSFEKLVLPAKSRNASKNYLRIVNLMNKGLEEYIKLYPEQWFWVHRRWKGSRKATPVETIEES
ncbi:MAG: lysophospholipid acyltransferase family protein [Candidatus Cloacimonadia bacterium]